MQHIADGLPLLTRLDVGGTGCTNAVVAAQLACHCCPASSLAGLCDLSLQYCEGVTDSVSQTEIRVAVHGSSAWQAAAAHSTELAGCL